MELVRLRWTGHVVRMGAGRSTFKILTGKLAGKRHSKRPRRRWEGSNRMLIKKTRYQYEKLCYSAQDMNVGLEPL